MPDEKRPQCPLKQLECNGPDCAWYCALDSAGSKKAQGECSILVMAQTLKAISLRPPKTI